MREIVFDQHDGYWIGYKDELILWLPPLNDNTEEIVDTIHVTSKLEGFTEDSGEGYTFSDLRLEDDFRVFMTVNEDGIVVAWFTSRRKNLSYALMMDGSDVGTWGEFPTFSGEQG